MDIMKHGRLILLGIVVSGIVLWGVLIVRIVMDPCFPLAMAGKACTLTPN